MSYLRILYSLLTGDNPPQDNETVQRELKRLPLRGRAHQVRSYLIAAAEHKLSNKARSGWSLLFAIYWLQDHTSDLAPNLVSALLSEALKGDWPLENAVNNLTDSSLIIYQSDMQKASAPTRDSFRWAKAGALQVAINETSYNWTSAAMKEGADVYVAVSSRGSAIALRKGLTFTRVLPEGWGLAHPDLAIPKETSVEGILSLLPALVG
jgi:hypothetical protein